MQIPKFLTSVWALVLGAVVVIAAGAGTGYLLARRPSVAGTSISPGAIVTSTEVGIKDTSTFRDSAQGVLQQGGINGEGTHQLVRDGGPSQTVYLVSSVVDLDQFVGQKVEVWGETFDAAKAGWLMDVGLVKILD